MDHEQTRSTLKTVIKKQQFGERFVMVVSAATSSQVRGGCVKHSAHFTIYFSFHCFSQCDGCLGQSLMVGFWGIALWAG